MKAITTRYIGATNRKPARILATDLDGNRLTLPAEGDFPYDDIHRAAAVALCTKMGWPGAETLVGGSVKHGRVWVFDPAIPLLRRALPLLVQLGDHIGNGPMDPERADSLGSRCDLIGDIQQQLQAREATTAPAAAKRPGGSWLGDVDATQGRVCASCGESPCLESCGACDYEAPSGER